MRMRSRSKARLAVSAQAGQRTGCRARFALIRRYGGTFPRWGRLKIDRCQRLDASERGD
nr:MAG TPA: hypothetical protein [Caudoviricetes sp.]